MTDNRALWELVEADREFDAAEKERASLVDGGPKLDQCSTEHFDKVMAACERKGKANIRRREALAAIAILKRPVVVGDSRAVAEVADINGAAMCAVIDIKSPNVLVVGDKLYLRPTEQPSESMVRGKS